MLTPKISGIFDCRKYDQSGRKQHDQREMLADTDNITFSALFPVNEVPKVFFANGQLDEFARPRPSKREKEAAEREGREPQNDVVSVKFKIGTNCKWFDKHANACDRPTNADLEANRYNVQIDFVRREKDASNPLKPSGYWVNAIMFAVVENNPFTGQAFEAQAEVDDDPETDAPANKEGRKDDLPF